LLACWRRSLRWRSSRLRVSRSQVVRNLENMFSVMPMFWSLSLTSQNYSRRLAMLSLSGCSRGKVERKVRKSL
jgi:hypothetical protein